MGVEINQLELRHVHTHHAGDGHHRELILGHAAILLRRQLHDPRATRALGRNGQAAALFVILKGRELQLHTSQRKAQCVRRFDDSLPVIRRRVIPF